MEEKRSDGSSDPLGCNDPFVGPPAFVGAGLGFIIAKETGGGTGHVALLTGIGGAVGALIGSLLRRLYRYIKNRRDHPSDRE